jgi:hypothetical protein
LLPGGKCFMGGEVRVCMQIACACASASIAWSSVIAHSWCSMVLVMAWSRSDRRRVDARACAPRHQGLGRMQRIEETPFHRAFVSAHGAAGEQQFGRPALSDQAGSNAQHQCPHDQAYDQVKKAVQIAPFPAMQVGRQGHRAPAPARRTVNGRHDGLRAGAHHC